MADVKRLRRLNTHHARAHARAAVAAGPDGTDDVGKFNTIAMADPAIIIQTLITSAPKLTSQFIFTQSFSFSKQVHKKHTGIGKKVGPRLRESCLLALSGRGCEFTQPTGLFIASGHFDTPLNSG